MAAQIFPVVTASRRPVASAAVAATALAATGLLGYPVSVAVAFIPVLALVVALTARPGVAMVCTAMLIGAWLITILATPGPLPRSVSTSARSWHPRSPLRSVWAGVTCEPAFGTLHQTQRQADVQRRSAGYRIAVRGAAAA